MSNQGIIDELLSTSEYYESAGDDTRAQAYKRAVNSIRECGFVIRSGSQAKQLKWIGDSISSQIDDILGSGGMSYSGKPSTSRRKKGGGKSRMKIRKTTRKKSPDYSSSSDYESTSKKVSVTLIDDIREKAQKRKEETSMDAIDDIRHGRRKPKSPIVKTPKKSSLQPDPTPRSKLNKTSRTLRIKQYEYAPKPEKNASTVRRSDIDQFLKCVKRVWDKLIDKQSSRGVRYRGRVECCGGFRRGQTWCHECVIVLTSDMSSQRQRYALEELLRVLYKIRLIESKRLTDTDYYQGVLDISQLYTSQRTGRQPDNRVHIPLVIRLVDEGAWPCALLRWTGPKGYWVKLQSAAQRQNYELLENGLYTKQRNSMGKRLFHRDEYDVLTDLDMGYLEPIYRK
jgi:DNA polymerase/3'-5' exonuclease PolX